MITKDQLIERINARLECHPLEKQIGKYEHESPMAHALVDVILETIAHEINNVKQLILFKCQKQSCPKCGADL